MSDKELFDLNGGVGLTSAELDGAMGFYLVDPVNGSRFVTLEELKTFVNTDPTVVPSSVPWRGARVSLTANQTFSAGIQAAVSWGAADVDTDNFWSISAPTRLTIPTGITRVRLTMQGRWNPNGSGVRQLMLAKNGSATLEGRASTTIGAGTSTNHEHGARSAVLDVVATNYFEILGFQNSGGNLALLDSPATWFEIEVVEASA